MSVLPSYETINVELYNDHILIVTLNRPDSANALNSQMGHDLLDLWNRLIVDPDLVRCLILTGAGEKIFCAGGDLKERQGMSKEQWLRQHELFERMYWTLVDLPLPVIAAVNGHAFGGGLEMLMCCDFIYASSQARFALPEVSLGIMPGAGGTQNLPRAIGERRAKEILMTGKPFSCEMAVEWGLINQMSEPEKVMADAIEVATLIANNAPLSVRQIKKAVRYGGQMELRTAYRFEVEAYNHLIETEDRYEGVKAFNEKRKPNFKGK